MLLRNTVKDGVFVILFVVFFFFFFFVSRILVEILKTKKVLRRKSVGNRFISLYTNEIHSYV